MVESTLLQLGLTSVINFIIALGTALICYKKARKKEAKLLLWASYFIGVMGLLYLGPIITFVSYLITGENISPYLYMQLSYIWAPLGVALGMNVGMSLISEKYRKTFSLFYLFTYPVYIYALFFIPPQIIEYSIPPDGLLDANFIGWFKNVNAFLLFSFAFILIIGFAILAKKSSGAIRKRSLILCLAFFLFLAFGYLESSTDIHLMIIIARIGLGIDYFIFFLGFSREI